MLLNISLSLSVAAATKPEKMENKKSLTKRIVLFMWQYFYMSGSFVNTDKKCIDFCTNSFLSESCLC
jgi:hypothetical protein